MLPEDLTRAVQVVAMAFIDMAVDNLQSLLKDLLCAGNIQRLWVRVAQGAQQLL